MNPDETSGQPTRWYALGYAVAITFLIANFFYTSYNLIWTEWSGNAASTSRETVETIDEVLSILKDAETGQRGYLLTGDEKYLEPYHRAVATATASIDHLRSLAAQNYALRVHFDDVAAACSAKLAELGQTVDLRRNQGFDAAVAVVKTNEGKILMDRIRAGIAAMRTVESATRTDLRTRRRATLRQTLFTFTLTSGLALALLFGVHSISERSRIRSHRHTAWLSTALRSIGDAVISTDARGAVSDGSTAGFGVPYCQ
jgi:CHASE3 domain sensor protein